MKIDLEQLELKIKENSVNLGKDSILVKEYIRTKDKINLIDFLLSANSHLSLHLYITIYNKPQSFNIKGTLINKCITIFVISLNQI